MSRTNNSMDTVNAAAMAIVTAESRVQQVTSPRRRWGGWLSMYWCFGSQRQLKRINHACVIPETTLPGSATTASENITQFSTLTLPFVAPPSSPASFNQSEPPSAINSPVGLFSLSALAANVDSPGGPASIFAIGPYAHETQLVSPPAFTTESSTAPFTPPESVYPTTPPSPEVPFSELLLFSLDSNLKKNDHYEFHNSYQPYRDPGSPIGRLISPSSVCSGTSSPFPDLEFHSLITNGFPSFPVGDPPKLLTAEYLAGHKTSTVQSPRRNSLVSNNQITAKGSAVGDAEHNQKFNPLMNHSLSFELTDEEVSHFLEKEPEATAGITERESESHSNATEKDSESAHHIEEAESIKVCYVDRSYHDLPDKLQPSTPDRAAKEFKFDNADGSPAEPSVGSDWWANEKVVGAETSGSKNWAFFPIKQPGVS